MNENEDIKIKELLSSAYGVTPDPVLQKRMEKERVRIMRELPRGIRSPLITLRLVLMIAVWGALALGCLFFYEQIFESLLMVYRYFTVHEPVSEDFVFNHLPYYLLVLLGIVETYQFGKEVL